MTANTANTVNTAANTAQNTVTAVAEKAHSVQHQVEQALSDAPNLIGTALKDAEALARNGIERARQASVQARDSVNRAGERTVGYIQDEPVKSVLIAAAVGAASAALITWLARSRG
jgi:ElaB/YqjD/DUF883 family membrane-anchored ribosome-binding protein